MVQPWLQAVYAASTKLIEPVLLLEVDALRVNWFFLSLLKQKLVDLYWTNSLNVLLATNLFLYQFFFHWISIFSDRLNLHFYPSVFSSVTTSYVGPFITRSLGGHNSVSTCLTECFFTSANDCHFAFNNGNTCYIGTFKLWPIENPPYYSTATAYIYNGMLGAIHKQNPC